jgi:L-fucose isomerase-like protein
MKGCPGVIIGNRGVFPGYLAEKGREEIIDILKGQEIEAILVSKKETKYGAIENLKEAKKCAELFRRNHDKIDGILISLPNFGDERAIAEAIRMSGLSVPVLVQAYPDELTRMEEEKRRDSFCGKLSVCSNLKQYGILFSLTSLHTVSPSSKNFLLDLEWFMGVCRVVKGLSQVRIGVIGARTTPFKTVRFSERLLEDSGISVETVDLSEIIIAVERLKDSDKEVQDKLKVLTSLLSDERSSFISPFKDGKISCCP